MSDSQLKRTGRVDCARRVLSIAMRRQLESSEDGIGEKLMREIGEVIELDEKTNSATMRFYRHSACSNCGMCMFKDDAKYIDMKVQNTLELTAGEQAIVEVSSHVVVASALIAYMIPVLFALVGLVIGIFLRNELIQLALCLGFLILGYIIIIILDKRFSVTRKLQPVMIEKYKKIMEEL